MSVFTLKSFVKNNNKLSSSDMQKVIYSIHTFVVVVVVVVVVVLFLVVDFISLCSTC